MDKTQTALLALIALSLGTLTANQLFVTPAEASHDRVVKVHVVGVENGALPVWISSRYDQGLVPVVVKNQSVPVHQGR